MGINLNEDDFVEDLIKAAKPLNEFLKKYYHPHTRAIVTVDSIEIIEGVYNIPDVSIFNKEK